MQDKKINVAAAPKTATFQMRINPEVKAYLETLFASCGMTMTDAINAFFQQSINVGGIPFIVTKYSKEALREQAVFRLMYELARGEESADREGWLSKEDVAERLGISL